MIRRAPRTAATALLLAGALTPLSTLAPAGATASARHAPAAQSRTGAPLRWSAPQPIAQSGTARPILSLACPTASACFAGDSRGNVLSTQTPTDASSWTSNAITGSEFTSEQNLSAIDSLACPSTSLCAAGVLGSEFFTTTTPASTGAWSPVKHLNVLEPAGTAGVSCPSVHLCFGLIQDVETDASAEGSGIAFSTTPADAGSWHLLGHTDLFTGGYAGPMLLAINCPTVSLCVAVDDHGKAHVSTTPLNPRSWRAIRIDRRHQPVVAIDCPSASVCAAVDTVGNVITTTAPTSASWTITNVAGTTRLNGIACASAHLCVAVGPHGTLLSSTDPVAGQGSTSWSAALPSLDSVALDSVACPSARLCLVGDGRGDVLVGQAHG